MEDNSEPLTNSGFLKQLASSNSHARREAVESLRVFLQTHGSFNELELLKLWKYLYYCMWMSDRPKAQQQLARDFASFVTVIHDQNVLGWLKAFWITMSREWSGIDALRMNKFLYLIRQNILATFRYLSRNSWADKIAMSNHLENLSSFPLNPTDERISNGIRFHVLDVYVDELDRVDHDRDGNMPLTSLLQPLKNLRQKSPYKFVRDKAEEALADKRLREWQGKDVRNGSEEPRSPTSPLPIQDSSDADGNNWSDEDWEGIEDG